MDETRTEVVRVLLTRSEMRALDEQRGDRSRSDALARGFGVRTPSAPHDRAQVAAYGAHSDSRAVLTPGGDDGPLVVGGWREDDTNDCGGV